MIFCDSIGCVNTGLHYVQRGRPVVYCRACAGKAGLKDGIYGFEEFLKLHRKELIDIVSEEYDGAAVHRAILAGKFVVGGTLRPKNCRAVVATNILSGKSEQYDSCAAAARAAGIPVMNVSWSWRTGKPTRGWRFTRTASVCGPAAGKVEDEGGETGKE